MAAEVALRAGEVTVAVTALVLAALVTADAVRRWRAQAPGRGPRWATVAGLLALYAGLAVPGLGALWFLAFPLVVATYPDGRLVPRWLVVPVGLSAVAALGDLATGGAWSDRSWWGWVPLAQLALLAVPVHRYRRRASTDERTAVRWALLGTLLTVAGFGAVQAVYGVIGQGGTGPRVGALLAVLPVMVGLAVGMLRPRLVEVDAVLRLVVAGLAIVGALTVVVLAVPADLTWARVVAVAALGGPAAWGSTRLADWLVYRGRPDPDRAVADLLAALNARTGHDDVPRIVLTAVLRAAYLDHGRLTGSWFDPVGADPDEAGPAGPRGGVVVPILWRGEEVAVLHVAPRRGESELTARDRRVVAAMAAHAAPALDGTRTLLALQDSRRRVVSAREEERRRVRRELHDDLGPTLAGLALSASALATATGSDDARRLHAEIRDAVGRSRELAYALRPPVLDDHGLVAALRDQLGTHQADEDDGQHGADGQDGADGQGGTGGPRVRIEAPDRLDLPAAVDLAALRISCEAVANARKHADAREVRLRLAVADGLLRLEVADDGVGLPADVRPGVGMHSIAERADELGGTARYDRDARGCRLLVELPLEVSS